MRVWTLHTLPGAAEPVLLVREGFARSAVLLGPVWLLAHRLWVAALVWLGLALAATLVLPAVLKGPALLGLALLTGAQGRDLERRRLARLGYREDGVIAARDHDAATARLLAERPDLAAPLARAALGAPTTAPA